jgi:hypothetical protein
LLCVADFGVGRAQPLFQTLPPNRWRNRVAEHAVVVCCANVCLPHEVFVQHIGGPAFLSEESLLELKGVLLRNCFTGGVGLLSALIAAFTQDTGLVSGMVYFLLWPLNHGSGIYIGRKMRRLQALAV